MKDIFIRWIKKQVAFVFWTYIPFLAMIVFAILAAHYLSRDVALKSTGAFVLLTMVFVFFRK